MSIALIGSLKLDNLDFIDFVSMLGQFGPRDVRQRKYSIAIYVRINLGLRLTPTLTAHHDLKHSFNHFASRYLSNSDLQSIQVTIPFDPSQK